MILIPDIVIYTVLAIFLGGLIGYEREHYDKPAGLRDNILICLGSMFMAWLSIHVPTDFAVAGTTTADPGRIMAQVISGVGFLGAGAIMQSKGEVHGMTTASTIWIVSAIGLLIGSGYLMPAILATIGTLFVLVVVSRMG